MSITPDSFILLYLPAETALFQISIIVIIQKNPTYALKTPRVVALPFIYGVECICVRQSCPLRTVHCCNPFLDKLSTEYRSPMKDKQLQADNTK